MKVTITSGSARTKPKTGDVRTTKKHGLQIRVPEMHQIGNDDWAYVVMNGRQRYEWKTPQQLIGTRWEYLTVCVDGKIDSVANIARNMTLTQQQIIALAVEAGFDDITPWLDAENVEQGQIDAANRWIERMTAFAALVSAKENQARIKLQREFMEYQNDMQARGTRLIKEAYQRGVRDERNACLAEIETGIWMDNTTEEVLAEIADAIRARSDTPKQLSGWHRAVDEEMVLTHLGVADPSDSYEAAKKKLNDLIAWHVAVATDPAVNGGYVLVRQDSATIPTSSTTE